MAEPGTVLEISVAEALRVSGERRIIDVREPVEWNEGHIPEATLVPLADLAGRIEEVVPDKATPILVHCAVGARSRRAALYLSQVGYTDVVNIQGRLAEWKALGGAWEVPTPLLSEAERRRYSRQVLIPEIGQEGQRRLLDSRVLLIGAGGLGSPAALYLAAVGLPPAAEAVPRLAELAAAAGCQALVCSPLEVAAVRTLLGEAAELICPGVRPAAGPEGRPSIHGAHPPGGAPAQREQMRRRYLADPLAHDQARVATPAAAMEAGASWIVVGRPVTGAADVAAAASAIRDQALAAGRARRPHSGTTP